MTTDRAPAPATDRPLTAPILERIAFNLCSLHDFDPAYVASQERFAKAVITEYERARPAASDEGVGDRIGTHSPSCWSFGTRHYECALSHIAKLEAALASPPVSERERELEAFGQRRNLELSYRYGEEGDDGCWQVHQVNGGVNDREWTLIGSGETPADAIHAALTAQPAGEGE